MGQTAARLGKAKRNKKGWKKPLSFGLIGLMAISAACAAISIIVGWKLTHPERKPLYASPADYHMNFQEIRFPSRDRKVYLQGWFLPASLTEERTPMTVIFAHGYRGNRLEENIPALELAKKLTENGYHVLMFDFRNSGESEGELTSVGQFEKFDLLGAVDWVQRHVDGGKIAFLGFSMGASASILAAAEEPAVAGVIADSPFKNLVEYLKKNLSQWSGLPDFPFTPFILKLLPPLTGLDPKQVDPYSALDKVVPRPILFIHGGDDQTISPTESEEMWRKYPGYFQFWKVEGVGHIDSYARHPEEYTARILEFLERIR